MICVNKKITIVVFFFILLGGVILVIVIGRNEYQKRIEQQQQAAISPPPVPSLSPKLIAKKTLQWLDVDARTENGTYSVGQLCQSNGTCDPQLSDDRIGAVGLWAQYRSYLDNKSLQTRLSIERDINSYSDKEKVPVIQTSFWNCKLLFEMWNSSVFSQSEKDKIKLICGRSSYNPMDIPYQAPASLQDAAIAQLTNRQPFFNEAVDPKNLQDYAINTSEEVAVWEWYNRTYDFEQAHLFFIAALGAMDKTPDVLVQSENAPLLGLAALDLGRVTAMAPYQKYAEKLFTQYKNTQCNELKNCVMRAIFYNELYKLNQDNQYKQQRDKVIEYLYNERFDALSMKGYYAGKGAFFDQGVKKYYDTVSNAMMTGLLLEIK